MKQYICAYCQHPILPTQSRLDNWDEGNYKQRKSYHRYCFETYQANITQVKIDTNFSIIL